MIDYKFWYIKRDDDGVIFEAAIRFYEGEITTADEMDVEGKLKSVTRYRRSKRLQKKDMTYVADKWMKKEGNGNEAIVYTTDDFGKIKSDDELRAFLNGELKKDTVRDAIVEQTETDVVKLNSLTIK